jgi:hypothetical protein
MFLTLKRFEITLQNPSPAFAEAASRRQATSLFKGRSNPPFSPLKIRGDGGVMMKGD